MSRTAFSERSPDNAQYFRKTLAQRLYLPQLRQPEGLGTCRQALHLRMRRLRPTNFRDRQNRLPSQPPAASHLVPSISPQGLLRRIRLAPLANFWGASIGCFVTGAVVKGATIVSDGFASYRNLKNYNRQGYIVGTMAARVVLPGIHRARRLRQLQTTDPRLLSRGPKASPPTLPRRIRLPMEPKTTCGVVARGLVRITATLPHAGYRSFVDHLI